MQLVGVVRVVVIEVSFLFLFLPFFIFFPNMAVCSRAFSLDKLAPIALSPFVGKRCYASMLLLVFFLYFFVAMRLSVQVFAMLSVC